jgi:hypothetical protein
VNIGEYCRAITGLYWRFFFSGNPAMIRPGIAVLIATLSAGIARADTQTATEQTIG